MALVASKLELLEAAKGSRKNNPVKSIRATVVKEVAQGMGTEETTATRIKSFISVLDLHFLVHVGQFATLQHHAAEGNPRCQVRACERLSNRDYEVESVGGSRGQRGFLPARANHPLCGVTNDFALVIEQETDGAGRFDFLGKAVLHRQRHHSLAAGGLHGGHAHRQLRGRRRDVEEQDKIECSFHFRVIACQQIPLYPIINPT